MLSAPNDHPHRSRRKRGGWYFWGFTLLALALMLAARPAAAWWARQSAAAHLQAGRIGEAERWLDRTERLDPDALATAVLRARVYRHLDQRPEWQEAVEQLGAAAGHSQSVKNEQRMGGLRWDPTATIAGDQRERLIDAGVEPDEASLAVAYGLLAAGEQQRYEQLLRRWQQETEHPQQPAFLRGVQAQSQQDWQQAMAHFQAALDHEPDHEMAHAALAQLADNQGDYETAAEHFAYWVRRRPGNEQAVAGWARVLRDLGQVRKARRVLQQYAPSPEDTSELAVQWGHVEFELGNYDEAAEWFRRSDLKNARTYATLRTAAIVFSLQGDVFAARNLFERVLAIQDRQRRIEVLSKRLAGERGDRKAAEELRQLHASPADPLAEADRRARSHPISPLFAKHCASCHGSHGRGDGPAARHLYPPARDLHGDRYRLVSSTNGVPRVEDIEAVIRDGIPGTAMPAFDELSDQQRRELSEQVHRLRLGGMGEEILQQYESADAPVEPATAQRWAEQRIAAARSIDLPAFVGIGSKERIAEGRRLYAEAGCAQCHGDDGRGRAEVPLFTEDGSHAIPRDLVSEPMKGGDAPQALFARLRVGMPGTPHPAHPTLEDDELVSLVAFCRSLAETPRAHRTNWQRALEANRRAIGARVGDARVDPVAKIP